MSIRVRVILSYIRYLKAMDKILLELLTHPPQTTDSHMARLKTACRKLKDKASVVTRETELFQRVSSRPSGDFQQCAMLLLIYSTRISYIKWLALRLNNVPNMYYPIWLKTFKVAKMSEFSAGETLHITSLGTRRCYTYMCEHSKYRLESNVYDIIKNEIEELNVYVSNDNTVFTDIDSDDTELDCDRHTAMSCGDYGCGAEGPCRSIGMVRRVNCSDIVAYQSRVDRLFRDGSRTWIPLVTAVSANSTYDTNNRKVERYRGRFAPRLRSIRRRSKRVWNRINK